MNKLLGIKNRCNNGKSGGIFLEISRTHSKVQTDVRGLYRAITAVRRWGAAPVLWLSAFVLSRAIGGEIGFACCETLFKVFAKLQCCFITGVEAKCPLCPGSADVDPPVVPIASQSRPCIPCDVPRSR